MTPDSVRPELRQSLKEAAKTGDAGTVLQYARELLALGNPADAMLCATVFQTLRGALVEQGHRALKTFLVRSTTLEPILPALKVAAVLGGYVLDAEIGGFGSYVDEMMNPDSSLGKAKADLVLVLLDTEELAGRLPAICAAGRTGEIEAETDAAVNQIRTLLQSYRAHHTGRLVLQGCVLPQITAIGPVGDANQPHSLVNTLKELNRRLALLCGEVSDCIFFDVDGLAAQYGRSRWRDTRMYLASRLPIASAAFETYAKGLMRTASVLFRAPRKILCTDLDNTLWGGILGEDGPLGIATGSAFPGNSYLEYQRYLKQLLQRGILLAVASKNNEADVEEAFQLRAADLGLTLNDFVAKKISWNEKVDSLRAMAQELSLGLDSFVFVDDNPVECAAVRLHLPEVAVVQVPVDEPWRLVEMLAEAWFFDAAVLTKDDLNRTEEYRAQIQRSALANSTSSRDEFLQSLGIVCTFQSALDAPLARAVQLLAKTNQFNLTTRRHSTAEVEDLIAQPGSQAVAVRVRDRFGDAGVVGLALARQEGDACVIDSFLLSCRVIGRGIEGAMLAHLAGIAARRGSKWIVGEYLETKKNSLCADFYPENGFERVEAGSAPGSTLYRLSLTETMPTSPSWLTLEGNASHES